MSGHTPGEWVWRDMGGWKLMTARQGALVVLAADGVRKSPGPPPPAKFKLRDHARCLLVDFDPTHPDARLIAAAPDLLAALKAYLAAKPQCECTDAVGCKVEAARVLSRAAVEKAEGSARAAVEQR